MVHNLDTLLYFLFSVCICFTYLYIADYKIFFVLIQMLSKNDVGLRTDNFQFKLRLICTSIHEKDKAIKHPCFWQLFSDGKSNFLVFCHFDIFSILSFCNMELIISSILEWFFKIDCNLQIKQTYFLEPVIIPAESLRWRYDKSIQL